MTLDSCYENLVLQVTIWCPIHDFLSGNKALRRDALDFLKGKYVKAPFQPPEWISECVSAMTPEELEAFRMCRTNHNAYEFLIRYRHDRIERICEEKFRTPEPVRVERRGHHIPPEEQRERIRLAPTMTYREFAEHFGITFQAAYKWNEKNGNILKKSGRPGGRPRRCPGGR